VALRALTWDIDLSGSINHNQLVTIGPGITATYGYAGIGALVQGYPLFSSFDYPFTYHAAPGQTILLPSDVTPGTTPVYIGPTYPGTQLTATSTMTIARHLHVMAQFDYRGGFKLANDDEAFRCLQGYCSAATEPGASLFDQARAINYAASGQSSVYGYYQDAEFIRFRELSVTYDLPTSLAGHFHARSASLTLAARNLALWTRFSGVDPEVLGQLGTPAVGAYFASGALPPPTYWIIRVNLGL
jgi:TonB-dependent starch-binding outer membrane protein SusC